MMLMLWCIGALFADGFLDPNKSRTFKHQAISFFLKKWEKYCAPHYGIETTCTNAYVESFLGG